jgi:NADH-quinone oxidoreductase subunit M
MGILTLLILLPLLGAVAIGIGSRWPGWPRRLALFFSLGTFALSLLVWARFDSTDASYQLVESVPWIPSFGISYLVGVDGVSLLLVLLTAFLTPLSVLGSWESVQEKASVFHAVLLVLESFLIGVFLAVDVFLFYVLWEALLVPGAAAWRRPSSSSCS